MHDVAGMRISAVRILSVECSRAPRGSGGGKKRINRAPGYARTKGAHELVQFLCRKYLVALWMTAPMPLKRSGFTWYGVAKVLSTTHATGPRGLQRQRRFVLPRQEHSSLRGLHDACCRVGFPSELQLQRQTVSNGRTYHTSRASINQAHCRLAVRGARRKPPRVAMRRKQKITARARTGCPRR